MQNASPAQVQDNKQKTFRIVSLALLAVNIVYTLYSNIKTIVTSVNGINPDNRDAEMLFIRVAPTVFTLIFSLIVFAIILLFILAKKPLGAVNTLTVSISLDMIATVLMLILYVIVAKDYYFDIDISPWLYINAANGFFALLALLIGLNLSRRRSIIPMIIASVAYFVLYRWGLVYTIITDPKSLTDIFGIILYTIDLIVFPLMIVFIMLYYNSTPKKVKPKPVYIPPQPMQQQYRPAPQPVQQQYRP
jgi:hypothetical protein